MRLGVDAGQQVFHGAKVWNLAAATRLARALAEHDIAFLEDPLLIHDMEGWSALKKERLVPIAGGEMFADPRQFERYIEAGAFDIAQPDAAVVSGPEACLRVAECARHRGVRVAMHGWAGPVAQMQNIHIALASPACDLVEFAPFHHPLMEELLAPLWKWKNGRLSAPTVPGLGVALPDDLPRRYPYQDSVSSLIA
jgi:D-arabinonate dehydratase/D-galactarolactone cycloisomerase